MIVKELISDLVPSIKLSDPIGRALNWMNELKLAQLPVVEAEGYLGMITEEDIMESSDLSLPVASIRGAGWELASIHSHNHVYEAIRVMSSHKLEVLPVLEKDNRYAGAVTFKDLTTYLSRIFAVHEPGGIVVLEIPQNGYVLSEIGRIVESADAKVLSLYLSSLPEKNIYILTIKLNVEDISRVVASFERFDYTVLQTYYRVERMQDYQKNLDALFNYLDI